MFQSRINRKVTSWRAATVRYFARVADLGLISLHTNARIQRVYMLSNKKKMEARACHSLEIDGCLSSILPVNLDQPDPSRNASNIVLTWKFWLIWGITVTHNVWCIDQHPKEFVRCERRLKDVTTFGSKAFC